MRAIAPDRVEVIYEPDLLPPVRYQGDHNGVDGFTLDAGQRARWEAHLARATILWDFPADLRRERRGLACTPNVRWVQTTSSGVGQLVHGLGLANSDLIVTTARGVHAEALAEFVFLALLAHAKDLPRLQRDQRAHHWERYCCGELAGKVLTVVGAGKVGAKIGQIAAAFGMRVRAVVNNPSPDRRAELHAEQVYGPDALIEAVREAYGVVLCAPHTPATERMIDARVLAAMRPAVFVNIGRGALVDEAALIVALQEGRIGFAALDVAAIEPLPASSPLWDLPNVLISPHSASTAPSENRKITDIFCHNLAAFLGGKPEQMINVLDKRRMY
jgi:phosphoglycerate dehydrogenase-like enzyme